MMQVVLIVIAMATGEVADPFYGDIPEETALFYLVEESAENQYIALQYNGAFIQSLSEIPKENSFVDVFYDTPWNPVVKRNQVFSRLKNPELSPTVLRRERLIKGWKAHHYALREMPDGSLYPVTEEQRALAERAQAMAAALEGPAPESTLERDMPQPDPVMPQPPFFKLWGMHLLVGVVVAGGIVLMILMTRRS